MYDQKTLAVHYDAARGEPRGNRKVGESVDPERGDCVDCSWCVQVCPVDIDIRDGLQYECINCGLCVDACNAVMEKMNSPKGLIRFTSENALQHQNHKIMRPRLIVYIAIIVVLVLGFAYAIIHREPLGIEVNRDRGGRLYRLKSDEIQNVYTVKVYNMDSKDHQYKLWVDGDLPFTLGAHRAIHVKKGGHTSIPVKVQIKKSDFNMSKTSINFYVDLISSEDGGQSMIASQKSSFFGPGEK
jgi:cytochrome c oxidase accessory protein FixG